MSAVPLFRPAALRALDQAWIVYKPVYNGEEVLTDCPDCGKEGHLYVNVFKKVAYCQRCQQGFTWLRLEKLMGLPRHLVDPAPGLDDVRALAAGLGKLTPIAVDELPEVELPYGTFPAWKYPEALAYLETRKIGVRAVFRHELRYAPYGPCAHRILFPIRWNSRLVGYQGRCIVKHCRDCRKKEHPKYIFSTGFPAARVFYPQRHLCRARILLVEGVIPALRFGGLATFGKKLTSAQLALLKANQRVIREVILAFDHDAWRVEHKERLPKRCARRCLCVPPAMKAWTALRSRFTTVGLMLPAEAAQPDHLPGKAIVAAGESALVRAKGKSSLWHVDAEGQIERKA